MKKVFSFLTLVVVVIVVSCGSDKPDAEKEFVVEGKHILVKGRVKTGSVAEAKAVISFAVSQLESE